MLHWLIIYLKYVLLLGKMVFMILLRGSLLVDRVCMMSTGSTVTMGNVTSIQAIHLRVSQCTTNNMSRVYDNPHPLPCFTWVAN